MKRRVRPLFGMLMLVVAAAFVLSFRVATRSGFNSFRLPNDVVAARKPAAAMNETLLKLAAVDMGEAQWKQEIEEMMEGNLPDRGRKRTYLSSGRVRVHHARARSFRGIPLNVQSPQFYRLWLELRKILHGWWRNRRFQPDIMSDLVNLVRVPIDRESVKYSSCAVVGNSGILLQKENGELIDSHEAVIRLNNARTSGFERHVGSKTTISFINSNMLHLCARREGCFCHPYGLTVPIVMYICQPVHFFDYALCNSSHRSPLVVTDLRFDLLCTRIVKYYSMKRFTEEGKKSVEEWGSAHGGILFHYSSGMQAVMLALGICDKVSVFGYGKSDSAKHHYHTNQKAELHLHDYEAEYDLYHDLVNRSQAIPFILDKFKFPPVVIYQ